MLSSSIYKEDKSKAHEIYHTDGFIEKPLDLNKILDVMV